MEKLVFGKKISYYKEHNASHTATEIAQQPQVWNELAGMLLAREEEIKDFMGQVLTVENLKIIFTGAGSSAFVGETMEYVLANELGIQTKTIHTTDIISAPDATLFDVPTLLISYARSGESPESTGAVRFAKKKIKNLYNIIIVCDKNSSLAKAGNELGNTLVIDMPSAACDKGFAMTSSVSCMALTTWCIFHYQELQTYTNYVKALSNMLEEEIDNLADSAQKIAESNYRRLIWLGTGALKGLAREAAIKSMELSDGYVHAGYDGAAGFRHGPKTVIDEETLTIHFISNQSYSMKYDIDLANELIREKDKNQVACVGPMSVRDSITGSNYMVLYSVSDVLPKKSEMPAYILSLVFSQLLSLKKSLEFGYSTDNPCSKGEVNRVVQGIVVYEELE